MNSWPLEASGYEIQGSIGKGAFSNVCRASSKTNNMLVAIKIMDLENISTSFDDIIQEVQTMRLCEAENILRCHCSFVEKDQLWLITELMDKGSCLRVMNVSRHLSFGEGMNEEWLAYIIREVVQGLHYLHHNGQIHRDIKSGNILLDSQGAVRLADFGVSGWTVARGMRTETVKTFVGTPCYMAPEVMEQNAHGYDLRADVWSLGITALELAKGAAPYARLSPIRVLILTIEEEPPTLKSYPNDRQRTGAPFTAAFEDFCRRCLQKNPRSRATAEELLRHKFLKGRSKDALVEQLLRNIPPVGQDAFLDSKPEQQQPSVGGTTAVQGVQSQPQTDKETRYVPGTSWVFDFEGDSGMSGVQRLKPQGGVDVGGVSMAGFMEDFEAEFSDQPQPEPTSGPPHQTQRQQYERPKEKSDADKSTAEFLADLEDFVDGTG